MCGCAAEKSPLAFVAQKRCLEHWARLGLFHVDLTNVEESVQARGRCMFFVLVTQGFKIHGC